MSDYESETWSGFVSKDGSHISNERLRVLDSFKKSSSNKHMPVVRVGNTEVNLAESITWRRYTGDVLIALMGHSDAKEMSELLIKAGYVDEGAYIRIAATQGINRQEAKLLFAEILRSKKYD